MVLGGVRSLSEVKRAKIGESRSAPPANVDGQLAPLDFPHERVTGLNPEATANGGGDAREQSLGHGGFGADLVHTIVYLINYTYNLLLDYGSSRTNPGAFFGTGCVWTPSHFFRTFSKSPEVSSISSRSRSPSITYQVAAA